MIAEMYIQNYRLDISTEISSLITFELDNIKNFAARSTTWSKTIVLPGTANNNKLFGHIFQIGQSNAYDGTLPNVNYNFNASKSADCIIFQDQMQTFSGVIRLLQINITKGRIEYEVAVFGKLAQLNVALSGAFLSDLDFSAYDHVYNAANIIASWDNTPGSGYYYPTIDYGTYSTLKHDWDIRTFRPAFYVREYLDKMFAEAGFRFESALFDTDRFKKLVVPHNKKILTSQSSTLLNASMTSESTLLNNAPDTTRLIWQVAEGTLFTFDNPPPNVTKFTYNGVDPINIILQLHLSFTWMTNGTFMTLELRKNGGTIANKILGDTGGVTVTSGFWFEDIPMSLVTTDYFEIWITVNNSSITPYTFILREESFITATSVAPIQVPVAVGNTIIANDTLPANIRQLDFLSSIIKLFNLYVYEDRFDTSLIYIKPFVEFYSTDTSNADDWSYKLNRDKTIQLKPMSELNARKYEFKYKPDSDYYNDLYRKRYNEGYGDYVFDSMFEFTQETESLELIFSSTPLVGYNGEEKIYPTIFKRTGSDASPTEEVTDSNIRILQTRKVTGVSSWDILDGVSVLASTTDYGYGGHFNDPDAPDDDLNFGSLRELFFVLVSGNLSITQFNVYWSSYMAEVTDKDSKLMTAWFYLTPMDILSLNFSKYKWIDGVLFRLNKVGDYNATRPTDTLVELFKVGYTDYAAVPPPSTLGNFLLWEDGDIMLWDNDSNLKYA